MDNWRFIDSGSCSGAMNMALDQVLFDSVRRGISPPVLRLYRWNPATVTLGYGQRQDGAVDLEACRRYGFDVVRRCTGGRAVLHDREVTYAVIAPDKSGLFPGGILDSYRIIAEVLKNTICSLGVEARLVPGRSPVAASSQRSVCFTATSSYELVVEGCKVAGSAQKRGEGAFLQHGSIPLEMDLEKLFLTLNPGSSVTAGQGAALLEPSVGWLNRFAKAPLTIEQVEKRLVEIFADTLGVFLASDTPSAEELALAEALAGQKYRPLQSAGPAWQVAR